MIPMMKNGKLFQKRKKFLIVKNKYPSLKNAEIGDKSFIVNNM